MCREIQFLMFRGRLKSLRTGQRVDWYSIRLVSQNFGFSVFKEVKEFAAFWTTL
jgi:hypothetical protein